MLQVIDYLKKNLLVRSCIFWFVRNKKNETYGYITSASERGWTNCNIIGILKKSWVYTKNCF
jgi:hypothetical protein